jgi:hypothetical protein
MITIDLDHRAEERLRAAAQNDGMPLEQYARIVLERTAQMLPPAQTPSAPHFELLVLEGSVPDFTKEDLYD